MAVTDLVKWEKFNNWEFIEYTRTTEIIYPSRTIPKNKKWIFKCICWNKHERYYNDIIYWSSKSCWCVKNLKPKNKCIDCWCDIWKDNERCKKCDNIHRRIPLEKRKASLTIIIRNSLEYKDWRKKCFERDNYTCQITWTTWWKLEVHHLKWFSEIFKENNIDLYNWINCEPLWDINNWITLSKEIHTKFHKIYWRTNFTLQNLLDFSLKYWYWLFNRYGIWQEQKCD